MQLISEAKVTKYLSPTHTDQVPTPIWRRVILAPNSKSNLPLRTRFSRGFSYRRRSRSPETCPLIEIQFTLNTVNRIQVAL